MTDLPGPLEAAHGSTGKLLVEQLARFIKSFSIYPENSKRVQENRDRMLADLQQCLQDTNSFPRGVVEVRVQSGEMFIGAEKFEPVAESLLGWLQRGFENALLAELGLSSLVTADSLVEFTRQFLDNQTRTQLDAAFELLWPGPYAGFELQQHRFDGFFAEHGDEHGAGIGQSRDGASDRGAGCGGLALDLVNELDLARLLVAEDSIRERIQSVLKLVELHAEDDADVASMNLVARIIKLMPAEALDTKESTITLAENVLGRLMQGLASGEEQLLLPGGEGPAEDRAADDLMLRRLLFSTSRTLFGRADGPNAGNLALKLEQADPGLAPTPKSPLVPIHAGDALIHDDSQLFFKELQHLPPLMVHDARVAVEYPPEQLGVYLYFLVRFDDARRFKALYPTLEALLVDPGPGELAVLSAYLTRHDEDEGRWRKRLMRIIRFLVSIDQGSLVRKCGLLLPEDVVAQFPRDFVLFLHTLDYGDPDDSALLKQVCLRIGRARLEEQADDLLREQGLNQWHLPRKLLSQPISGLIPLVLVLLQTNGDEIRPLVVRYLRRLKLDMPEAALLWIFKDPTDIPRRYLFRLLAFLTARQEQTEGAKRKESKGFEARQELPGLIAREIVRFLRETEGDPALTERRAYAVRHLATFRSPEASALLTGMLEKNRFFLFAREPRAVLRAVKATLKSYGVPRK